MSQRNVFYYDEASNLTCVRDPDISGKRSQEQARWDFPWRRLRRGAGGGYAAAA